MEKTLIKISSTREENVNREIFLYKLKDVDHFFNYLKSVVLDYSIKNGCNFVLNQKQEIKEPQIKNIQKNLFGSDREEMTKVYKYGNKYKYCPRLYRCNCLKYVNGKKKYCRKKATKSGLCIEHYNNWKTRNPYL